jgi:hypothetical protein
MSRRVSLPNADDLFRPTSDPDAEVGGRGADDEAQQKPRRSGQTPVRRPQPRAVAAVPEPARDEPKRRRSSGRVRHDEKMTVYVTADELVDIEHARLTLRRDHGLAVDRGRLVREALAIVLADLDEHGDDSELVSRLIR